MIGFFLPSYSRSIRKQQQKSPKFYLFDTGIKKALEDSLDIPIKAQTYAFGLAFEHFILLECFKLNHYFKKNYKFSYYKTKTGLELDLIIQKTGQKDIIVEIKSTTEIRKDHIKTIKRLSEDWKQDHLAEVWSLDSQNQKIEKIKCLHWKSALKKHFL